MAEASSPPRRVVTGVDAQGRSCILFDGPPSSTVLWSEDSLPADNAATQDRGGGRFRFPTAGAEFVYADLPPGGDAFMHATDTIDMLVVISGEVTLVLENGEATVRAGDVVVDRGVLHGWRNDSGKPCRIVNVLLPARPVGQGATLAGELDV